MKKERGKRKIHISSFFAFLRKCVYFIRVTKVSKATKDFNDLNDLNQNILQ